jgi:hypothetical protein
MHNWIHGHKKAATYCDLSLETWKRLNRLISIKRVKLPTGAVLFRSDWIDQALEVYAEIPGNEVETVVKDVLKDLI